MLQQQAAWEENSPDSLLELCTRYCVDHLGTFCSYDPWFNRYSLREGITLPIEICEKMLSACGGDAGRTVDDDLLKIFRNPRVTRVRRANLRGSHVTDAGLALLLQHGLVELDISHCNKITVATLRNINKYGSNMISLNIGTSVHIFPESLSAVKAEMTFPNASSAPKSQPPDVIPPLAEPDPTAYSSEESLYGKPPYILNTPNLRKLTVREFYVPLEPWYFTVLLRPLVLLTSLDLSGCYYLGHLEFLVPMKNLQSLVLYNVPRIPDGIQSVCQLKSLRHLDVSQHNEKHGVYHNPNRVLAQIVDSLPNLVSLDISGTNLAGTGVAEHDGTTPADDSKPRFDELLDAVPKTDVVGLRNRVQKPLEFLGLYNTSHDACTRHHIPAEKVTGSANEMQILTAARVYADRPEILQKVLNDLFHLVRYETCRSPLTTLQVIIAGMQKHLSDKHIQISGSASLFYLVKGEEKKNLTIKMKRCLIKTILDSMSEHKYDTTMMRNGCLTLCQFKIPKDVLFDYERLVQILLHIVAEDDQEEFVQRIAIYLLNSLACQVDGNQKQLVGDWGAVAAMLSLIENRLARDECDDVMEIAWSTMWNVTDETPINCQRFLDGKGMNLFLECLKKFPDKAELLRNMMGLLGNVAEMQHLRSKLMTVKYVSVFRELLSSASDGIEVSYNAAGVISHLASDGPNAWHITNPSREDVLRTMVAAIDKWNLNTKRNINYRSFEPILRLLRVDHTAEVQHWAVWALANLTRVYPDKYCPLVQDEGGLLMLQELMAKESPYPKIKDLARLVVMHCERFHRNEDFDDEMDDTGNEHHQ